MTTVWELPPPPKAALVSRHPACPDLMWALWEFEIVPVNPLGRCDGWLDMWRCCLWAASGFPALVVLTCPSGWVAPFVEHVAATSPDTMIWRPVYDEQHQWTGRMIELRWDECEGLVSWERLP